LTLFNKIRYDITLCALTLKGGDFLGFIKTIN